METDAWTPNSREGTSSARQDWNNEELEKLFELALELKKAKKEGRATPLSAPARRST